MKHDVFISYSSCDQKVVEALSHYLEENKIRCFVAYRDIPIGKVWAEAITEAIEDCQMMVVVFSENFNASCQVDREIEICSEEKKPILTYRITDTKFRGAKRYYLKNLNWIDAFPNPKSNFGELLDSIRRLIYIQPNQTTNESKESNRDTKANKDSFSNEFKTITFDSGDTYVGEVNISGNPHGKGVYTWAAGDKYEGNFFEGMFHGKGILTYANRDKYEGDFFENNLHGKGVLFYASGNKYKGDFFKGKFHGGGIYTFANGDKYEGGFFEDKRHGKGVYTWANGQSEVQEYNNGNSI